MQIFALETNVDRLKAKLFSANEREIFTVRRHVVLFVLRTVWYVVLTMILVGVTAYILVAGFLDPLILVPVFLLVWLVFVVVGWIRAFIDWQYDFIFLTNEKLVIVDQTTILRRSITSLSLDSIAQVNSHSQWLNVFGFGTLEIAQREGQTENFILPYLPDPDRLVTLISDQISSFNGTKNSPPSPSSL
jgi:hypothetical protein